MAAATVLAITAAGCQPKAISPETWRAYEADLISDGLLRTDRAPADAPITNESLIRNFHEIIFFDEYVLDKGRYIRRHEKRTLEKLRGAPRLQIFGSTVTERDRVHIRDAVARIAAATGLEIVEVSEHPTIRLAILKHDERLALKRLLESTGAMPALAADLPGLGDSICAAYSAEDVDTPGDLNYVIVIPAETGGVLRRSCVEEELGQTFGPAADFDGARPSVFNDDEEFALLTEHDELLLRVLYDPRQRVGMTAEQAMPIVARIVEELRPGG